jgi:hypothetical protein
MRAVLQQPRPAAPKPVTAPPAAVEASSARPSSWVGDHVALWVWCVGALLMASLLLKDLIVTLLRW